MMPLMQRLCYGRTDGATDGRLSSLLSDEVSPGTGPTIALPRLRGTPRILAVVVNWRHVTERLSPDAYADPADPNPATELARDRGAMGPGRVGLRVGGSAPLRGVFPGRHRAGRATAGMLAELRRRADEAGLRDAIEMHQGDAQQLPFASGAYDGAFSMFGLMFFPDRHAGLTEMRRVLKPGARAVVSSWVPFDGPFGALMQTVSEHIPGIPLGAGKQPMATPREITEEMTAAGFRDVRGEVVSYAMTAPSFDVFWDSMQRTNAPQVLLIHRLGDRWNALAPKVRERVRANLGDGELALGRGAYLGIGSAGGGCCYQLTAITGKMRDRVAP